MKKNGRKHLIGTKLISSALVMSLLLCCFTACSKDDDTSVNVSAESNANIEEQNNGDDSNQGDIDDGDVEEVAPQANNGQYTYTLYGETICMGVNIDDYLGENDEGNLIFFLPRLVYDLGWYAGEYTSIEEQGSNSFPERWWYYADDGLAIKIDGDKLSNRQFGELYISYIVNGSMPFEYYYNDNRSVTCCYMSDHFDDCIYIAGGTGWRMTYDDAVLVAYILWAESTNPGSSSLVALFSEDSSYASVLNDRVEFNLP